MTLYRDPETGLLVQVEPDTGTPERARQQGGIAIGQRYIAGRWSGHGAWAVATGTLEAYWLAAKQAGIEVAGPRMDAAAFLLALAEKAGLRKKLVPSYDVRTTGGTAYMSDGAARAHAAITEHGNAIGWPRMERLLTVIVHDMPHPGDLQGFLEDIDRYAAFLRLPGVRQT